jgi:ABC-type uncharacterized transport system permease subunit
MTLTLLAIGAYLSASFLLMRYFNKHEQQHPHRKTIELLIIFALITQALTFSDFWTPQGVIFGLANSASFASWMAAVLLLLSSISKPVHALGFLIYPLVALILLLGVLFPDTTNKIIALNIASHVFLSIAAYALLALAVCQSVLLKIQKQHLHAKKINSFIDKFAPLETMEALMFQGLRIGFYLLSLSLLSGFIFIDDIFTQHLLHKTVLSLIAWLIFLVLFFGRKTLGWHGRRATNAIQIGFGVLLLAYFGSKFVLERLLS